MSKGKAVVTSSKDVVTTDKGATVRIALDKTTREQIANAVANPDRPQTVQVKVEGVVPPANATSTEAALKLFVNKPDASTATSEKDPHFVGAAEFQPTTDRKPQSFLFDISRSLAELQKKNQLDLSKPLTVSIVLSNEKGTPPVKFDSVQVAVPK